MILQPCKCGHMPLPVKREWDHGYIVQLKCQCGAVSIEAAYRSSSDEARSMDSAIKAWNIEHGIE